MGKYIKKIFKIILKNLIIKSYCLVLQLKKLILKYELYNKTFIPHKISNR
jgi:hypothetical protein